MPLCIDFGYIGKTFEVVANIEDFLWTSTAGLYYVLLGWDDFVYTGVTGHDNFVIRRGTYYGGPPIYDPKGLLDIDPPNPEL